MLLHLQKIRKFLLKCIDLTILYNRKQKDNKKGAVEEEVVKINELAEDIG